MDGPRTVPAMLADRAALEPKRLAIETQGVGSLTFADWDRRATAVATGLLDRGLRPGERVGLFFGIRDWIDYAVAFVAVLRAGGVAVPCADRLTPADLRHVLAHCAASALLHADGADPPSLPGVWACGLNRLEAGGAGPVEVPIRPGDPAQIIYTSGTTGRPKGVAASHANLTYGSATHPSRRRLGHSAHFLHAFPVGTNAGQAMLMNALDARPTALTLPLFTPARFARLIEERAVGTVFVVPTMAVELLASGALGRHDMSGVALFGSTAAALPPSVARELTAALPNAVIVNYYTSTEAAPAQTSMIFDPERPGSVGRPVDGALRVADVDGAALPAGEVGEVWLRAPYTRAYYADPESSRQVFQDGWVRMGDVGYLDDEGYLHLVDRDTDVIKSGAVKVSTLRVEAALHEHPAIAEVAVLGLPHPALGAVVGAAVVLRPGGEPLCLGDLRAFLTGRLAGHEQPSRLAIVPHLPRNVAGKVLKRELHTHFDNPSTVRGEARDEPDGDGPQAVGGAGGGGDGR